MDPSLMTKAEIARRGRVIVDPCQVCKHNRQAHILEGVFLFEAHGQKLERDIEDACVACTCLEFVEAPEAAGYRVDCCSYDKPHKGFGPLGGPHWVDSDA